MKFKKFVLTCIDNRFVNLMNNFYNATGQSETFYLGTAAGSSLPLSYSNICKKISCCTAKDINYLLQEGQLTNLNISQLLSEINEIDILDHQDCGAFKQFLPCSDYPLRLGKDKEKEKKLHEESLVLAENNLRKKGIPFMIQKLLIDINGSVGKFIDGQWTIIYTGSGKNPDGLWYKE